MRLIMVPVADQPECVRALHTAFDLAQQLGASVCGCHIRPHEYSEISLSSHRGTIADNDLAWEKAWATKVTPTSGAQARSLFAGIAAQYDYNMIKKPGKIPGAYWLEKVGSPDRVIAIMGPVSDLIVVSRPKAKGGKIARMFLLAAVLNSSRPVLVLPQAGKSAIGKRICIAWNQSPEAALAVAAAIPLLRLADQVNIVTNGPESATGPKCMQLATYLGFWGIRPGRIKLHSDDDSKTLIQAYKDTRSDLLVMGGYSRSRLRQHVFGGVTEFMLHHAKIPVLILHT